MQKSVYSTRYKRLLHALKNARVAAGLTQAEAAERLKKPQSFVSKCEAGERRIDVIELLEYCRIYNISAEYILAAINGTNAGRSRSED